MNHAPIFAPDAWGLTKKQAELCTQARDLAAEFEERGYDI